MENFVDSYLRMFYEDIIGETNFNNQYIGKIELDNFFKNIIIVNDDLIREDKNVIFENKNVEYGDDVLNFIFNASFGQQIKKSDILVKLDENWKFFEKYKKSKSAERKPILFYKFDFSTDDCLKMFRHLDNDYVNSIGEKNIVNSFHENIKTSTNGFVKDLGNCIVLGLNKNASLKTIKHELTHYFQIILNVNVFKTIISKDKIKYVDIPELGLTKDDVKSLFDSVFSKSEFPSYLYVNIVNDLSFIYENFFNNISKPDFINSFINDLLKYKKNIFKSKIGKLIFLNIDDKISITILALSAEFNIHLKKILKCLRNEFK